jgi:hypothetical protein
MMNNNIHFRGTVFEPGPSEYEALQYSVSSLMIGGWLVVL